MDQATIIALLAVVVSIWSAIVSHKALNHAKKSHITQQKIDFERERFNLLEVFNDSRKLLDKTRIEIGTLKAQFNNEPDSVKALLVNYTSLFTEYLPTIEKGLRQANALWDEVANWDESEGIHALIRNKAHFRALVHGDQVAHDQGLYCVAVFKEKLDLARKIDTTRQ